MTKTHGERIAVLENEDKHFREELSDIKKKLDNIDDFLINGFTERIINVVKDEFSKYFSKPVSNNKKNVVSKIWQNDNFWKYLFRLMVIIVFLTFMLISALLGIDLFGENSMIMKLLTGTP